MVSKRKEARAKGHRKRTVALQARKSLIAAKKEQGRSGGRKGKQERNEEKKKNKGGNGRETVEQYQMSAMCRGEGGKGLRTLLVGEGDFSFAAALTRMRGGTESGGGVDIVATGYDEKSQAFEKYGMKEVESNVESIESGGGVVAFDFDATRLMASLKKKALLNEADEGFDRVCFNFPHHGKGIKDERHNVIQSQKMLAAFFSQAGAVLRNSESEVHLTVKKGKPYDLWRVPELAREASKGVLRLRTAMQFFPSDFPGYNHRRTIGFREGNKKFSEEVAGRARTYIFRRA